MSNPTPTPTRIPKSDQARAPDAVAEASIKASLTHEECMKNLSQCFKAAGMNDETLSSQMEIFDNLAKNKDSTDPLSLIEENILSDKFKQLPEDTKYLILSVKKALTPDEPEQKVSGVDSKPADVVHDKKAANESFVDQKVSDPKDPRDQQQLDQKDADAASLDKKVNDPQKELIAQLQQQLQEKHDSERNMVPITLGGAMASGLGRLVKRLCDGKESGPGKSFTDLQAAGDGLGMNNPNRDAAVLAEKSLVRSETAADNLAGLKAGATPEEIAKAKKGVIDAADDAQLYLGNKHRSDIAEVASGKKTQFDAKDEISAGSDRLQKSFDTAKNADVAIGDDSFQEAIKTNAEKAKEMVKQLMDSLKEIASKLFGAGAGADNDNDNDNKKTAAPKPAGPR